MRPQEDTEEITRALEERVMPHSSGGEASSGAPTTKVEDTRAESQLATSATSVSSPLQAMRHEEVRRMRFFTLFVGTLATIACTLAQFLPGDATARNIHMAIAALTALTGFSLAILLRDESRYRLWMGTVLGIIATTATATGFYFWGVHSFLILVVPIGTFFFALGESYRSALVIHVLASISHLLVSALQITGTIPDVGVIKSETLSDVHRWGILLALQVVFLGTFVMARAMRRSSRDTLERLDEAVRDIARREVLLQEAKEDLAQALQVGGPGRFTGQVLGSFRLGTIIGRGGMGDVYGAVHVDSGELAALKMLNRDGMTNSSLVARFYRELETTRSIQNEHIVRVLEFPEADAPIPYLAMERLHGQTLGNLLRTQPEMRADEMLTMLNALARGIGAAHDLGIVHRDLKPGNIFAHQDGNKRIWKILDFGVSTLFNQTGTLTRGKLVGTPSYMSPEQATGDKVDARSDIYSIGVIAYRVLTGRRAFFGPSIPALLRAVHADMPPRPSGIAELSHEIDCVFAIAMAKKPDDRFSTADELAKAFEQAVQGRLSAETQERGEALIDAYPWGERNVI